MKKIIMFARVFFLVLAVAALAACAIAQTEVSSRETTNDSGAAGGLLGVASRAASDRFSETGFNEQLAAVGPLSVEAFAKMYPAGTNYLDHFDWGPTNVYGWKELNATRGRGQRDMFLNLPEYELLYRNGFMVSERLAYKSFGDLYDAIYQNDLPVFVTCDMILHAWHRSFDLILKETELYCLRPTLDETLQAMTERLSAARNELGGGPLAAAVQDADFYLGVARSLLAGRQVPAMLGQDERVGAMLKFIQAGNIDECAWFGTNRVVDASQFIPQGHYAKDPLLQTYFQAIMWLGYLDLRIADGQGASPRQLGLTLVLDHLLEKSGKKQAWSAFDKLFRAIIGEGDALGFNDLDKLLAAASLNSIGQITDKSQLEALAALAAARGKGIPRIAVGFEMRPDDPQPVKYPVAFAMLSRCLTPDGWALAQVGGERLTLAGQQQSRRMASALDVAFSVFSNNAVAPDLARRMKATNGIAFRDGINYAPNLVATRQILDADAANWTNTLYGQWLLVLRELSSPTTSNKYPQAMRTKAWALKTLNTQLASWTQLKHDTVLYAKQPEYIAGACLYPKGYVEPRVEFWERFEEMAVKTAELIEETPYPEGRALRDNRGAGTWDTGTTSAQALKIRQASFLRNFAQVLGTLREIAQKELTRKPLTMRETTFLQDIIEIQKFYNSTHQWNGWYPRLFYGAITDCEVDDALVSAVLTDCPNEYVGDPGAILHEAVGNVNLLVVAIEDEGTNVIYTGGVMSHHEFAMPFGQRMTDADWSAQLMAPDRPAFPEWTRDFLAPGFPLRIKIERIGSNNWIHW